MRLSSQLLCLLKESYANAFVQKRTQRRALELALGTLCALGRRTLSRSICAVGRHHQDWSADYKLYSRSPWEPRDLFDPVLKDYRDLHPIGPIVLAFDDTKLPKTGRKICSAFWQRDPLSPAFRTNLLYGLRFLQVSLIFPHYRAGDFAARAVPVRFVECPAVKKPGKRASVEQIQAYKVEVKVRNLSIQGLEVIKELRARLDALGEAERTMLVAVDGSLCNRNLFGIPLDRVDLVARCRKDARLCLPASEGTRRKYGKERFTPEEVRADERIAWQRARIHYGGTWRAIRYKELNEVLWQRGARTRRLRLLVIAPLPYRISPRSRVNYRRPAFLLATDTHGSAIVLLQAYFDRWQIEVNHREEKETLGVGQAQVWSPQSVPRQPAFAVAAYSLLLLAALRAFGPGRPSDLMLLPKWRKRSKRPSALDLITLLRREINETHISDRLEGKIAQNLLPYAYA